MDFGVDQDTDQMELKIHLHYEVQVLIILEFMALGVQFILKLVSKLIVNGMLL